MYTPRRGLGALENEVELSVRQLAAVRARDRVVGLAAHLFPLTGSPRNGCAKGGETNDVGGRGLVDALDEHFVRTVLGLVLDLVQRVL